MQMRQDVNNDVSKYSPIVSSLDSFFCFIAISRYYYFFIISRFPHIMDTRLYYPVVKGKRAIDGRSYKTSVPAVSKPLFNI